MIYNGTGHEINLLDSSELNNFRGDILTLKDNIESPTILKTIEKNIELNIDLGSVDPYIGESNGFNVYMSDVDRIIHIAFPENYNIYNKIIVSSTYVNRILQYYFVYPQNHNFDYLNRLYVVEGTVKQGSKVIGCVGLKKVIPGRTLEYIVNYYKLEDLDKIDISELCVSIRRFRSYNHIENNLISKDVLHYISDYINSNGISYNLELNTISK